MESVKAASDVVIILMTFLLRCYALTCRICAVYSCFGSIEAISEDLRDQPGLINKSAEKDGQCDWDISSNSLADSFCRIVMQN